MKHAYNDTWLYNLAVVKESKRWLKQQLIAPEQFQKISETYTSSFYHPNLIIRILLFVATLFALSGVTGLFFLVVAEINEKAIASACILYGAVSFVFLEKIFIENNRHYKSGVNEALLYHACGFTIGGVMGVTDFNEHAGLFTCLIILLFAAYRYLDLLCTIAAVLSFAGVLFYEFYNMGGLFQQIIPFIFIFGFALVYLVVKKLKKDAHLKSWSNNLLIVEFMSLAFIYSAGNYLVVRELSIPMLNLHLEEGQDIPFAFIFYALTVVVPIGYLYVGIRNKDMVLLRVSLLAIAFSAFTFKFYFSLGRPEITLTTAGVVLTLTAIALLNYLKVMRGGFTRENILTEKWSNLNAEAFIISQTMGGNRVSVNEEYKGGGGGFGGGGASGGF